MAQKIEAYESNGKLFKTLKEARETELTDDLAKALNKSAWANDIRVSDMVRCWPKLLAVLENYAMTDKLLGGK
jgi:hypothetical protein